MGYYIIKGLTKIKEMIDKGFIDTEPQNLKVMKTEDLI